MTITKEQIKIIKTLQGKLGIDDDTYRDMLYNGYEVKSCKELTYHKAEAFKNQLKSRAIAARVWEGKSMNRHKYNNMDKRSDNMATPKQLRMIGGMWAEVSRVQGDPIAREKALDSFIKRITGKDSIRFITKQDASKLVNAIGAMKK